MFFDTRMLIQNPKKCNHWLTFMEKAAPEELNHTMHGPKAYSS
jgi:hypothetical protein